MRPSDVRSTVMSAGALAAVRLPARAQQLLQLGLLGRVEVGIACLREQFVEPTRLASTTAEPIAAVTVAPVMVIVEATSSMEVIVAIVPDVQNAWVMLHCENFAADVRGHRLWLVVGEEWETQLAALLREREGLPIPSQFVRVSDGTEELAEAS